MLEKRFQNYDIGRSSGTHGRIWCECSLANLCRVRPEHIVDNPKLLPTVVAHVITHHQRNKTKR